MRRMSSGALCTGAGGFGVPAPRRWCVRCGGVCFPGVPGFRRCCVCATPASRVLERRKTSESRRQVTDHDSSYACHFQPCMSPINRHRFVSDALHGRCTSHAAPGGTNSCGVVHINSCCASACGNSRVKRGREDLGEMKTLSTSTRCAAWRPAVEELAPLQQASGSLHGEAWAGRVGSSSLRISQEVEIETGCVVTVFYLPSPDFGTSSPGW